MSLENISLKFPVSDKRRHAVFLVIFGEILIETLLKTVIGTRNTWIASVSIQPYFGSLWNAQRSLNTLHKLQNVKKKIEWKSWKSCRLLKKKEVRREFIESRYENLLILKLSCMILLFFSVSFSSFTFVIFGCEMTCFSLVDHAIVCSHLISPGWQWQKKAIASRSGKNNG